MSHGDPEADLQGACWYGGQPGIGLGGGEAGAEYQGYFGKKVRFLKIVIVIVIFKERRFRQNVNYFGK